MKNLIITTYKQKTLSKLTNKTNIYLQGPPGAGKSSVSKELGKLLKMDVIDIDDDILEKDWGMSVSQKLSEVGDENFIIAEGGKINQNILESTMKINVTNTIISLTGSNSLYEPTMKHIKSNGIIVYLDVDTEEILERCYKMKVTRIVGQSTKTLREILNYRKPIYEKYYDCRILVGKNETVEDIAQMVVDAVEKDQEYVSTRGSEESYMFNDVIQKGLAKDRGLFVPKYFPKLRLSQLERLLDMKYEDRCLRILEMFPLGELTPQSFYKFIVESYSSFTDDKVLPITKIEHNHYLMEEYYGPTASFKDLALQLFPKLYNDSIKDQKQKSCILVATSGDTGSAVLAGFKEIEVPVIVLYPHNKISKVQQAQMITAEGNVCVLGVEADFDFCQTAVKDIFSAKEFTNYLNEQFNVNLSSANSINWGRLFPQIFYTIHSYLELVKEQIINIGDKIDVCIPSGNFGQILGAFMAKRMGLPLDKLICASNENNILTDFINTGEFDLRGRKLFETISPAIDILLPSNVERLLYFITSDSKQVGQWFSQLANDKYFKIDEKTKNSILIDFIADSCTQHEVERTIKEVFQRTKIVLDPHTAVAKCIADRFVTIRNNTVLIAGTAHYAKFPETVMAALGLNDSNKLNENFNELKNLKSKIPFHKNLEEILNLPVLHDKVIAADLNEIKKAIVENLNKLKI